MTALGILAIGTGTLLIYAGVTGQSARQLVTDTLTGQGDADGELSAAAKARNAELERLAADL